MRYHPSLGDMVYTTSEGNRTYYRVLDPLIDEDGNFTEKPKKRIRCERLIDEKLWEYGEVVALDTKSLTFSHQALWYGEKEHYHDNYFRPRYFPCTIFFCIDGFHYIYNGAEDMMQTGGPIVELHRCIKKR